MTRYLEEHPDVVTMLVAMGGSPPQQQQQQQRVENSGSMDYHEEAEPPAYAHAQEQMYQHSQAILAHQSSLHEQGGTAEGSGPVAVLHQQASAEPHPGVGVTQNDLVTALAGVMGPRGSGSTTQGRPTTR